MNKKHKRGVQFNSINEARTILNQKAKEFISYSKALGFNFDQDFLLSLTKDINIELVEEVGIFNISLLTNCLRITNVPCLMEEHIDKQFFKRLAQLSSPINTLYINPEVYHQTLYDNGIATYETMLSIVRGLIISDEVFADYLAELLVAKKYDRQKLDQVSNQKDLLEFYIRKIDFISPFLMYREFVKIIYDIETIKDLAKASYIYYSNDFNQIAVFEKRQWQLTNLLGIINEYLLIDYKKEDSEASKKLNNLYRDFIYVNSSYNLYNNDQSDFNSNIS